MTAPVTLRCSDERLDADFRGWLGGIRHESEHTRELTQPRNGLPLVADATGGRWQYADNGFEQRGLPCTVRADHGDHGASIHLKGHIRDDIAATAANRYAFDCQSSISRRTVVV